MLAWSMSSLLEKSSDADLLREMIGFTAQRLMELEVEGLTGAAHGERCQNSCAGRCLKAYRRGGWLPALSRTLLSEGFS